jgi:23S rRNA (guanosine2251-2'-O)-methyltransferase
MARRDGGERTRLRVFGRRAVLEALAEPQVEVERAMAARTLPADFRRALAERCRQVGVALELASAAEVSALSREPRHDQGVAAELRLRNVIPLEVFLQDGSGSKAREPVRLLVLAGLTNPSNVGMVVRSACALGMHGVVWPRSGVPWSSGLVVKASAAALYRGPILDCETLLSALLALRARGYELIALDAAGGESLESYVPGHRLALILGSESEGLAPDLSALVDRAVRIRLSRGVESLNVAAAAAVACYHVMRSK